MHFAASKNNLGIARKLINHKASTRVKDKRGQLPLHRAAAIGSVPMAQLLIDNNSPINATDMSGFTSLHHGRSSPVSNIIGDSHQLNTRAAISEGHGDTALLLLKAGAETDKKNVDGLLPIELAPDTKVTRPFLLAFFQPAEGYPRFVTLFCKALSEKVSSCEPNFSLELRQWLRPTIRRTPLSNEPRLRSVA